MGELWIQFLRFYSAEFDFATYAISIRQRARLLRFEKLWTSKCMAIEDPFDLSHNLGVGLSRNSKYCAGEKCYSILRKYKCLNFFKCVSFLLQKHNVIEQCFSDLSVDHWWSTVVHQVVCRGFGRKVFKKLCQPLNE